MTIREALVRGSAFLAAAGNETAALDAALLLAGVLRVTRTALMAAAPDDISGENFDAFEDLLARRREGECVAYILGRKEFFGLDFSVNPSVLVPRPDTETLVEAVLEERKRGFHRGGRHAVSGDMFRYTKHETAGAAENNPVRILDLCTGSGAVAIVLKNEMPEAEVWAADISPAALATARENAARLLAANGASIQFRQGDLFGALSSCPDGGQEGTPPRFSVIVSNPPYVPSGEIAGLPAEVRREPRLALDGGGDGLDIIRSIIADAPQYLDGGGVLLLEADPRQMPVIASLLERAGFGDVKTYHDLAGRQRVIGGRKK